MIQVHSEPCFNFIMLTLHKPWSTFCENVEFKQKKKQKQKKKKKRKQVAYIYTEVYIYIYIYICTYESIGLDSFSRGLFL